MTPVKRRCTALPMLRTGKLVVEGRDNGAEAGEAEDFKRGILRPTLAQRMASARRRFYRHLALVAVLLANGIWLAFWFDLGQ